MSKKGSRNLEDVLKALARDELKPAADGQRSKYVSLEQIQKHLKKNYPEVSVRHAQRTDDIFNEVTGEYLHTNYRISTALTVDDETEQTTGSQQLFDPTDSQRVGAAQTYLRRYNLLILSNMIITEDPDDTDGALERYVEPANPDYEIILAELITELNSSQTYKDLTARWSKKVRTKPIKELPQTYKDRANAVKHKLRDGLNAAA